jgi:hypothetical protein
MTPLAASSFLEALFVCMIIVPLAFLWGAAVYEIVRQRRSGWGVAGWLLLVCIIPIIGPLVYFAMRPPVESGDAEAAYLAHAEQARERAARPIGGTGMYQ